MNRALMALLLALATISVSAANSASATNAAPIVYRDSGEEQRFRELTAQLRCVMCQNQSLADSNAPIAHDLRLEVLRLMRDGRSDDQIRHYLVARYSAFILYRPEVKPSTWLLWFGPGLLLLAGAVVVIAIVRGKSRGAPVSPPTEDSQEW